MKLWDLMSMTDFRTMVTEKYVRSNEFTIAGKFRKQTFRILNYTEKAQFENVWNGVTTQCRGLVIDENWNVVARPFDKFMNMSESDQLLLDEPVHVTDKMDGSLGIIFCTNQKQYQDHWHDPAPVKSVPAVYIAPEEPKWTLITRGSYDSEQAQLGREMLKAHQQYLDPNWTYLVEIIYPENRIVVNYGDRKDLVWLGARHTESGLVRLSPGQWEWFGSTTKTFDYKTLREALEHPPRANAEGYVVYFPKLDYRIKVKQEDYVTLHKIVTGLTARRVWENMKEGKTLDDLLEIVPDEWHQWLKDTYYEIKDSYTAVKVFTGIEFAQVKQRVGTDDRKAFAKEALTMRRPGFLFSLLDGKDISDKIWDEIRPAAG